MKTSRNIVRPRLDWCGDLIGFVGSPNLGGIDSSDDSSGVRSSQQLESNSANSIRHLETSFNSNSSELAFSLVPSLTLAC